MVAMLLLTSPWKPSLRFSSRRAGQIINLPEADKSILGLPSGKHQTAKTTFEHSEFIADPLFASLRGSR